MEYVSFYCAFCGELLTLNADLQGTFTYCPHCKQGLSVPYFGADFSRVTNQTPTEKVKNADYATPVSRPASSIKSEPESFFESLGDFSECGTRQGVKSSSVLIRSFLFPNRSKRVDVGRSLNVDWFKRGELEEPTIDESLLLDCRDLTDDEFIERLNSKLPEPVAFVQPYAPRVYAEEEKSWNKKVNWKILTVVTAGVVALIGLAAITSYCVLVKTNPEAVDAKLIAPKPVDVEGVVTYRTKNGKLEGDDGAFVFLFPARRAFDRPLVVNGAKPNRPTPLHFDDFLEKLEAQGGYFERAGFEGLFSIEVKEPGSYKILVVSYNVRHDLGSSDKKTVREIEKYLFNPGDMLERNRFLWTTKSVEGERCELDFDFGKASR